MTPACEPVKGGGEPPAELSPPQSLKIAQSLAFPPLLQFRVSMV
jgi:hypothetical protein